MKHITSIKNDFIKNILRLQKKKNERKSQGVFIVEGLKGIKDLQDKAEIVAYVVTPHVLTTAELNLDKNCTYVVTEEIYQQISDTETPQGAMAIIKQNTYMLENLPPKTAPFYLLLENLQDPGNVGTIIRTAYGLGVDAIILSKGCVDIYSPKVIRATMSGIMHVPLVIDVEMTDCLKQLKDKGLKIYTTDLEDAIPVFDISFKGSVALVIGNEGNGVTEETKRFADKKIKIPMPGGLESLNASVATGICLYEAMKQRELDKY